MHRPGARLLEKLAEHVSVEPSDGEPLRAAGRGGDDVDILRAEAPFTDDSIGINTGKESERTHSLNATRRGRRKEEGSQLDVGLLPPSDADQFLPPASATALRS